VQLVNREETYNKTFARSPIVGNVLTRAPVPPSGGALAASPSTTAIGASGRTRRTTGGLGMPAGPPLVAAPALSPRDGGSAGGLDRRSSRRQESAGSSQLQEHDRPEG
jgi:hypothetical protein